MAISVQVPFSFPSTDIVWIHYGIKTARYHLTSCATVVVLIHYGITPVQVPFGIPNSDVVWIHYGINSAMPFDILRNCIVSIRSGILQVQVPFGSWHCISLNSSRNWSVRIAALWKIQSIGVLSTQGEGQSAQPFQCAMPLSLLFSHHYLTKHLSIKGCCIFCGPHYIITSIAVQTFLHSALDVYNCVGIGRANKGEKTSTITGYCVWHVCEESM